MQQDYRGSLMFAEESHLQNLHKWLTFEVATAPLTLLAFAVPGFLFQILIYGAILFSPFLLWRLFQCKRYGWIAAFILLVGIPLGVRFVVDLDRIAGFFLTWFPLIMFYLYTFALRHSVSGWLEELKWKRHNRVQEMRRY